MSTLFSSLTPLSTCSLLSTTRFTASFPMLPVFDWLFPFPSLGLCCRSLLFPWSSYTLPLGQEGLLHCAFKLIKFHLSPCYKRACGAAATAWTSPTLLPFWERKAKDKSPSPAQTCSQVPVYQDIGEGIIIPNRKLDTITALGHIRADQGANNECHLL